VITQVYSVPRTQEPQAVQLAKVNGVASKLYDSGELDALHLVPASPPSVVFVSAPSPGHFEVTCTYNEDPLWFVEQPTTAAKEGALANLFTRAIEARLIQVGVTFTTTIT